MRSTLAAVFAWTLSVACPVLAQDALSLQDLYRTPAPPPDQVTVFVAREIVTMSPVVETATAVAVRDGRIIDAGNKDDLLARFQGAEGLIVDETFADKVLTPGLIDPHLHFWLFALVANTHFITPADWRLPWGDVNGVVGEQAYRQRLAEVEASLEDPDELLVTWGYHEAFHGGLNREVLDEISSTRPIIVWQRSVHEMYFNTKALEMLGQEEADWQGKGESSEMADWEEGHVWEKGLYLVVGEVLPLIGDAEQFELGLKRTRAYVHAGGITAAADPGVSVPDAMVRQMIEVLESGPMPFDYYLIPAGNILYDLNGKDAEQVVADAREKVESISGNRIKWVPDQIKLFTDGAVFSQLMQMKDGYLDGHDGEWIQTPEDFAACAWEFWRNGYQIIVHQNGDQGLELGMNTLEGLQHRLPRYDHRFRIDHFAFSELGQVDRVAELGAEISSNPFYLHVLGEQYSEVGVGPERSELMVRGRTVVDSGARLSFHSDSPMAPARPMLLVWAAVNRLGLSGQKVLGPQERVTPAEAFRAITIDAAHAMRMENEMGSIDIGKMANFTVFDENPIEADPEKLKDLAIWGTVFEGAKYPIEAPASGMTLATDDGVPIAEVLSREDVHDGHEHHGDACTVNQMLQAAARQQSR